MGIRDKPIAPGSPVAERRCGTADWNNPARVRRPCRRIGRAALAPPDFWLGIFSLATAVTIWELGARSEQWFGVYIPPIGLLPPPDLIFTSWFGMLWTSGYWADVLLSFWRVLIGFVSTPEQNCISLPE